MSKFWKIALVAGALALLVACVKVEEWYVPDEWTLPGIPDAWRADFPVVVQTVIDLSPGPVQPEWFKGGVVRFATYAQNDPAIAGAWTGGVWRPYTPEFEIALTYPKPPAPGAPRFPFEHIEQTALAHEMGHYLWERLRIPHGDHPPEFQAWWQKVNAEIARRLGR